MIYKLALFKKIRTWNRDIFWLIILYIIFKVCKLVLTHIGKNFPCTQLPGHTPTGNENTVWGFAGTDFAEDTQVVLAFAVRQK